jgi:hypothetical protein
MLSVINVMEHTRRESQVKGSIIKREPFAIEGAKRRLPGNRNAPTSKLFPDMSREVSFAREKYFLKCGTDVPTPAPKSRISDTLWCSALVRDAVFLPQSTPEPLLTV